MTPSLSRDLQHGNGHIQISADAHHPHHRSVATTTFARSPLRLLTPRSIGHAAWVITSTFGGGLLAGDAITLTLQAAPHTTTYLATQSSTKIYRSPGGQTSTQSLHATLADHATLVLLPDPVSCFRHARYQQTQTFDLAPTANLLLLDALTAGRHAPPRAERWLFSHYRSHNTITLNQKTILSDTLLLDPLDGPLTSPFRLGSQNIIATLILLGPKLIPHAQHLLTTLARTPLEKSPTLLHAISPLHNGILLRLAAPTTEHLTHFLKHHLTFLPDLLGDNPLLRKW